MTRLRDSGPRDARRRLGYPDRCTGGLIRNGRRGPPGERGVGHRSRASETTDNGQRATDNEQRLRAQYAEIAQLAGGLAHEIRNPLSTLQLNLHLLAEDFQNPETPRDRRALQRVERLRHEVQRLHGILENFLRFARIQDLELHPADLNRIVEELRDFYEPHAATKSIVIRTHFAGDLPPVMLEPDLFKQALLNLVLNAEHAMPSGGELILTTRRDGQSVVLDVTDTGVGMTEEVRARIFDAFFSTRRGERAGPADHAQDHRGARRHDPGAERARQGLAVRDPAPRSC